MQDAGTTISEQDHLVEQSGKRRQGTTTFVCGLITIFAGLVVNHFGERQWPGGFLGFWPGLLITSTAFVTSVFGIVLCVSGMAYFPLERAQLRATAYALGLVVLYGIFYGLFISFDSGRPSDECDEITRTIKESGVRVALQGEVGVNCWTYRRGLFLSRYDHVHVWGMMDRANQDLVLHALSNYSKRAHRRPMEVVFQEREGWPISRMVPIG